MKITVNSKPHELEAGGLVTYEQLVHLAGQRGTPTIVVSFGNRDRAGKSPLPGATIELDEGAHVTVVHTGNA